MKIPLVDLKSQYEFIKPEIQTAIQGVIDKSAFVLGDVVRQFEDEFAKFCDAKFCIGVGNGTDALHLALSACDIKSGDEVITTPHTFIATTEAISMAGAKIVFADIDKETFNIDPKKIEEKINKNTKAILAVHLYGCPCDMESILKLSKKYGLKIIEDACQAHGAEYKGRRVGSFGDVAAFSFFPGKNLGAYGDGGAVVTNNNQIALKVKMLRDHGRTTKYEHEMEGFNSRLDAMQASILKVKLKYLNAWNEKRRQHAGKYNSLLKYITKIKVPLCSKDAVSVFHLYVIMTNDRDRLREYLDEKGVATGIHYPIPLHLQKAYRYLELPKGSFPVAEGTASQILSLPIYPELTNEQIEYICQSIEDYYK